MRVVIGIITFVSFFVVVFGLQSARHNLLMTAAAIESAGSLPSAQETDEPYSIGGSWAAGPLTEEQYIAGMSTLLQSLGDDTLMAYQLNAQAAKDPILLMDKEWLEQIEQMTIHFRSVSDMVHQAVVPPSCAPSHEQIRMAVDHYDTCTELYIAAAETGTVEFVDQCNVELQAGYINVRLAQEILADMQAVEAASGAVGVLDASVNTFATIPGAAAIVTTDANLRSGPGTDYDIVGGRSRGELVYPIATNEAGDWVELDGGEWIAGWLLDDVPAGLPATGI